MHRHLLPKSLVFLIDRMPCELSAFFDLPLEELIQRDSPISEKKGCSPSMATADSRSRNQP